MALPGQLDKLPDAVSGDGAGEEARHNADHVVEGVGQADPLLQEEGHGAVGDLVAPEKEEAVAKGGVLNDQAQDRQEHIGLDGKKVVFQADLLHLLLPAAELFAVVFHHAEGLDGVEIIKGLHLKAHHLAARLLDLAGVIPLLADQVLGHEQHHGGTGKGEQGHDLVVMPDQREGDDEVIERNDDRGQPGDGVFADGADVAVEAVEQVSAGIGIDGLPVHVDDLVKDIRLDVIIDVDAELCGNAADQVGKQQAEAGAAQQNGNQKAQLAGLVAGDDIDQFLAGHAGNQRKAGAENAEERVKDHRRLVPPGIAEDPAPVLQDLPEGALLLPLAQRMERLEKRPFFFFGVLH